MSFLINPVYVSARGSFNCFLVFGTLFRVLPMNSQPAYTATGLLPDHSHGQGQDRDLDLLYDGSTPKRRRATHTSFSFFGSRIQVKGHAAIICNVEDVWPTF